jgi:hypothetical protein
MKYKKHRGGGILDNLTESMKAFADKSKKTITEGAQGITDGAKKITKGEDNSTSVASSSMSTTKPPVHSDLHSDFPPPQSDPDLRQQPQPTTGGPVVEPPPGHDKQFKGGYKPNSCLTNIASHAAPYNVPTAQPQVWLGGKSRKYRKGSRSKTHKGRLDFTTKKGDKVFHRKGHYVKKCKKPFEMYGGKSRKYRKGSRSKTHKGRLDFTTKKGDKVFHRNGHYVKKSRRPYQK